MAFNDSYHDRSCEEADLPAARRHLLRAVRRDPAVLRNLGIVSILLESVVGMPAMARYRAWRHGR